MLNLNNITKLIAVWGKAPLKIYPTQCLTLRYPKSGCKLCVDNCPTMAIEIKQDYIRVIDDKCTGCGICFNLCPTGAFDMTNFDSHAFIEQAQQFVSKDKSITIECFKTPFKYSSHKSLRLPCLAHIMPSLILKFISLGANEIVIRDAGICEVCESRCGDRIVKDTVFKTQELLKNLGLQQKLSVIADAISTNNLVYEDKRLKDYKDEPDISRRQIFSMFKKEVKKGVAGVIKKETPLKIDGKERLKKAMPKEREELLSALKSLTMPLNESKSQALNSESEARIKSPFFPTVTIANGCDMCRLCHFFCPTDALAIEDTANSRAITFKTDSCVGCSLCVAVCPKGILTLEIKETSLDNISLKRKSTIARFNTGLCAYCGRVFVKTGSDGLCDTCLKEKNIFSAEG